MKQNQERGFSKPSGFQVTRPISEQLVKNINMCKASNNTETRMIFRESWGCQEGGFYRDIEIIYICKVKRKKTDFFWLSF